MSEAIVICNPDYDNTFTVFGGDVEIHDIDLGRSDLRNEDEFAEWAESHLEEASNLRQAGHAEAAKHYEDTILDTAQCTADLAVSTIRQLRDWISRHNCEVCKQL